MSRLNLPGRNKAAEAEAAKAAAPMTRLQERRDVLREQFAELQWDLGGAAYEMAARDYYRLDVLASMASRLQVVDAELAEIERMARLESAGASGSCSGCGSLHARGAVYCWRCGRNLNDGANTVVGPTAAGQIVMEQGAPPQPEPEPAPPAPVVTEPPAPEPPAPMVAEQPAPFPLDPFAPDPEPWAAETSATLAPDPMGSPVPAAPSPTPERPGLKPEVLQSDAVSEMAR